MQILLKQVKIIDPTSSHHNQVKDIFIKNGKIVAIRNTISKDVNTVAVDGAHVSPGWMDVGAFVGDPGMEYIESLESISDAASAGGYTALVVLPNTNPAIDSKSQVEYIIKNSRSLITSIMPLGAITRDCAGQELAEHIDMHHAGAVAFTDGKNPVQNPGIMRRALDYVKSFSGLVINHPYQEGISPEGLIDEGPTSVMLGLQGIPAVSEVIMVKRDLELLKYTGSRLHVLNVSTSESLSEIAAAKAAGQRVTCSVPAINLAATSSEIGHFDVNYKVLPPLRSDETRQTLIAAVRDGTIDFITSNHRPVNVENKDLEFAYSDFGISALQSNYSCLTKALGRHRSQTIVVEQLSINSRKILGIPVPTIERNREADMTIFHPGLNTEYTLRNFYSLSKNNPFLETELPGHVIGIVNKGKLKLAN